MAAPAADAPSNQSGQNTQSDPSQNDQNAPGGTTGANSNSATSEQLSEIVVTGISADLEKALDTKEFAPVMLDSIDSTELGRFPDADVADSLEHLPGITVSRTTGGEGQKITVQGLSSEYNIVTMDNRILASDDSGRDIAFDVLPAELITGADVLKSPEASAVEGSIGGTVNLHTASAFDHPGFHADAHGEGDWNDMSHLASKKFSAFISDTNADRTLGFVLGAVDTDLKSRTDSLNAYNQNIYGPISYPYPPDGVTPPPGSTPLVATPCCITFGSIFDDKKRTGLIGNLEWRPSDSFRIKADGLWTHLNDPQIGYNESYYFAANPDGTPFGPNPTIQNGLITAMTVNNFQPEMVNNTINRKVDTFLYGLNAQWKPTDSLTFGADLYRSTASRPEGGQDTFVTAGLVNDQPTAEDILNFSDEPNSLPDINVAVPPSQLGLSACPAGTASTTNAGYCSYTALMNSRYLNNNNYWSTHYVGLNGFSVHDKITGLTLSGAWRADMGPFENLLFGVGGTDRSKEQVDSDNDWTNGSGEYGTLYQTYGCPVQCNPYSFGSQGYNVVSLISLPNFMEGAGGSYPMVLPELNVGQLLGFLKSLNGKPNPFYCTTQPCTGPYTAFDYAQLLPQVNASNSYAVTEKTITGYLEGDFGGSRWSGNLGLRMVHTTTTANTAPAVPVSLWTPSNTASSTQTWNVQYGNSQALGGKGSYTLLLPSLNLAYWVVAKSAAGPSRRGPDDGATGLERVGADVDQQRRERHSGARLQRHGGFEADPCEPGGPVARVVLLTPFRVHGGRVRQEGHGRHLRCRLHQCQPGHHGVCRRPTWHGEGHSLPVDGHSTGERRREHVLGRGAQLAGNSARWLRHSHAIHRHPYPQLRPVRQLRGRYQRRAADHIHDRILLRQGADQCGRQLGSPVGLHRRLLGMHGSSRLARDHPEVRLDHGESALPPALRPGDLLGRQESQQLDRAHIPQRQPAAALGARPEHRRQRERCRLWL